MPRIIKLSKENAPNEQKHYGCKQILDIDKTCKPLLKKLKENKALDISNEIKISKIVKERK